MSFPASSRGWLKCAALSLAVIGLSGVAAADECKANVEHISFDNLKGPLVLTFLEGDQYLECVNLVIDDRTFGFMKTWLQIEDGAVGDAVVLFDANDGPNRAMAANICIWSDGGIPGSNCDPMGTVTRQAAEIINTGPILTKNDGTKWNLVFTSDDDNGQGESDKARLKPVPEPGTIGLLAMGFFGFALSGRRRLLLRIF